jgi:hypothetical protein
MPTRDTFHNAVKNALQKEGWTITDDPFVIQFGDIDLYVDLGAERLFAAEKGGEKIAVEVKSFLGKSNVYDFHLAVGQFVNYRMVLEDKDPERALYLAVPLETYKGFFRRFFGQTAIKYHQLKLIICEAESEAIIEWRT